MSGRRCAPRSRRRPRSVFAGSKTLRERLERLVAEVDGFYARGAHRLGLAARDRELVPELDQFLSAVEAGVEALVNEALADAGQPERTRQVVLALMTFQVWSAFNRLALPPSEASGVEGRVAGVRHEGGAAAG
jgi:hypothetical protein